MWKVPDIVNEEEDNDEKEISDDEATLEDNDNSAVQENRETIENVPKRKVIEATPSRKRQKRNEDSEKLDKAFKILSEASTKASNTQEQSECHIFGNLVAKKLAKYSSELQSTVEQQIMNVLFKADRIHLKQSSTNSDHSQSYCTDNLQSFFQNSMPQQSQLYQDSQVSNVSNFTLQQSQLPSPVYTYASSSISNNSSRNTAINSSANQVLDMPDIDYQNL
ncbi:hypothetical protein WA026_001889 [Henosepilachna vigintioctopunctata]|uniref:BESS domain-containing protein n=1 Tax=Henosepilachna vigintioctopunctata TaxID=420089 RepID=A0AAW1UT81_9CUCU